jgi:hypothetical protein
MLFAHIQLHNFLTFRGTHTLEFPDPNSVDHALMLVLAPNTAGKTSIIRALRFLFCDDPLDHPNDPEKLINDSVAATMREGDLVNGWVQVKAYTPTGARTIRRRIEAKCVKPGVLRFREKLLEEQRHERAGDTFVTDQGEIQRFLSMAVPPALFDYFFFEGESLADRLLGGGRTQGIREGISTLIHDHQWEEASATVRDVGKKINSELLKLAEANKEYQKILVQRQQLEKKAEELQVERAELVTEKDLAEATYLRCESEIQGLSKGKSIEKLNKDLQAARAKYDAADKSIDRLDAEIGRLIGVSHGLPFLADAFPDALTQLEDMHSKKILPTYALDGFVNRILNWPQIQTCICGRSLNPDAHSDARKCIEEFRGQTMALNLSQALVSLLDSLGGTSTDQFQVRANRSVKDLSDALAKRDDAIVERQDQKEKVKGLEAERERFSVEEIQRLQKEQREANNVRLNCADRLKSIGLSLDRIDRELSSLQPKTDGRKSGVDAELEKLLRTQSRSKDLAEFIDLARISVKNTFHSKLQELVSQYYDAVAPDGSIAYVDKATLLPAIQVNGQARKNIGGAQRQLLVLSHIVSLAQLRKWLHQELSSIGLSPGKIDEHCFVLDSVFGPVADGFREMCAEFLVGKARQIVILVASQQWDDTIRTRLEKSANKVYRLVRCTGKSDIKPEERTMKFRKKDIEVFRLIEPTEIPYTVAEEVKL